MVKIFIILAIFATSGYTTDPEIETEELRARDFLQVLNKKNEESSNKLALAEWAYASNITDTNLQNKVKKLLFYFLKKQILF